MRILFEVREREIKKHTKLILCEYFSFFCDSEIGL